jgi:hypothetical protein
MGLLILLRAQYLRGPEYLATDSPDRFHQRINVNRDAALCAHGVDIGANTADVGSKTRPVRAALKSGNHEPEIRGQRDALIRQLLWSYYRDRDRYRSCVLRAPLSRNDNLGYRRGENFSS